MNEIIKWVEIIGLAVSCYFLYRICVKISMLILQVDKFRNSFSEDFAQFGDDVTRYEKVSEEIKIENKKQKEYWNG